MHGSNQASAYVDVPGGDEATFRPGASSSTMKALAHTHRAFAGRYRPERHYMRGAGPATKRSQSVG